MQTAASLIEISLKLPVIACCSPFDDAPKEPNKTFIKLRFIALHIKMVNKVPAAPTKIPPVSITWLSYKNPPHAAATPVKEFKREITTGISAPPMGKTNNTPYKTAAAVIK